jgi:hypothetical protein
MRYAREKGRLDAILADSSHEIWWGSHAPIQMDKRCITHTDVKHVLMNGQVTWFERKKDDIVHVEGGDLDGRQIRVVVGLRDAVGILRIITVIDLSDTG